MADSSTNPPEQLGFQGATAAPQTPAPEQEGGFKGATVQKEEKLDSMSPAERMGDAKVVDKDSPALHYGDYTVVAPEEALRYNVSDQAETALKQHEMPRPTDKHTMVDWIGDMGRATILGPLGDRIGANIIAATEDVSYRQALEAIRRGRAKKGVSLGAEIVGSVIGGGMIYKAGKEWLSAAATKSGLVDGALKAARNGKWYQRAAGAAAAGGGMGAVEEGIRSTLEESVDASAGMEFDSERIKDNMLVGATIGAAAGVGIDAIAGGGRWMFDYFKRLNPDNPAAAAHATQKILKEIKKPGETLEQAETRFWAKINKFKSENGYAPAAADILAPEQIRAISDVSRLHIGLDVKARDLSEKGLKRNLEAYRKAVANGVPTKSPMEIEVDMEDLFTDFMETNGKTQVRVTPQKMRELEMSHETIATLAKEGNEGAESILRVLDAHKTMDALSNKMGKATSRLNAANAAEEIADLEVDLATHLRRIAQQAKEEGMEVSVRSQLRDAIQLAKALEKRRLARERGSIADMDLEDLDILMAKARQEIYDFNAKGLTISLSDANNVRRAASRRANAWRNSDPDKHAAARQTRQIVSGIGDEVEGYRELVRDYNYEMLRKDAQGPGSLAAKGAMDLQDLTMTLKKGKLQGRARQDSPEALAKIQQGAGEGSRRQLSQEAGQSGSGIMRSATRVAESKNVQEGLGQTLGKPEAARLTKIAKRAVESFDQYSAMTVAKSQSQMAKDRAMMGELATGAMFGNLGGAGRAWFLSRFFYGLSIPRGTAEKMIEMMADPTTMDDAFRLLQNRGFDLAAIGAGMVSALGTPYENED